MIDSSFIAELEGNSLKGYVPDPDGSNSGVTIGGGFDLGQRCTSDLSDFPKSLISKLSPYLGLKKQDAVFVLNKVPLEVSKDECNLINRHSHKEAFNRLLKIWPLYAVPFDSLSDECQTVVASVAYQYGNLAVRCPNFWRQVTTGEWADALANLRSFGDAYSTRRNKEADLLEKRLKGGRS